jgi:TolA-binding protein
MRDQVVRSKRAPLAAGALRRSALGRGAIALAALGAALAGAPRPARALESEQAFNSAKQQIAGVAQGLGSIQQAIQSSRARERTPAQRIADAVLLMGAKDYNRAIVVLNEVIEKYPDHPTAYADALSMLGESYFRAKQYYSARRSFKEIVDKSGDPRFQQYVPKALGRLVDVTMRIKDYDKLDAIFASMSKVPRARSAAGWRTPRARACSRRRTTPAPGPRSPASTPRASTTTRRSTCSASSSRRRPRPLP